MRPILSVIVPTFNSSNYIIDLLHSINENFQKSKIEVVVVDDGSTDNTLNLVSDFSFNGNISRQIIKLSHMGASHARNMGLRKSSGQYIMFCDSDDVIVDSIESILHGKNIHQIISISKDVSSKNDGKFYQGSFNKAEILISMLLGHGSHFLSSEYSMGPYMKLFKRTFLKKNNIMFPENYNWWEDLLFNMQAVIKADSINFIKFNYYKQRENHNSVSHNMNRNSLNNAIRVLNDSQRILSSLDLQLRKNVIGQLKILLIWSVFTGYFVFHPCKKDYDYFIERVSIEKYLWQIAPNLQSKLLAISLWAVGFYPTVLWYGTIKRLKNNLEKKNEKQ